MLDNYQDLIDELVAVPNTVHELENKKQLSAEARALVSELCARDLLIIERLQRMTKEQTPHLRQLPDMDALAAQRQEIADDIATLVAHFDSARGDLVALLMNLTLRDWEKTATQDIPGITTVSEEIEHHIDFNDQYLARLKELIAE